MLRRVVIGVAIACLTCGAAYAVDEDAVDNECTAQLTSVEETVHDKIESNALNEADADKINELLDQADALCTEGKFAEATATLATVNKMVGK
jgi:soluble cytochrome b562